MAPLTASAVTMVTGVGVVVEDVGGVCVPPPVPLSPSVLKSGMVCRPPLLTASRINDSRLRRSASLSMPPLNVGPAWSMVVRQLFSLARELISACSSLVNSLPSASALRAISARRVLISPILFHILSID